MNSTLLKQMVLSREKTSLGKRSPPMAVTNADNETIRTVSTESTLQIPLPGVPTIGVFCTGKI
jgi:hypothetical protein